jgi:O-antigen ligase
MGHANYDGLNIVRETPEAWIGMESALSVLQFHQSFLDLLGIYGVIPGMFLVALVARRIFRMLRSCRSLRLSRQGTLTVELALVSMAIAALSMSHDSFIKEDNSFYVILFVSLVASEFLGRCPDTQPASGSDRKLVPREKPASRAESEQD